ncbi:MAG TPA: hypothetical protein ENK80_04820 [Rhodobacterales bacterium]|nr:hypothetical protein [Rhodobacterales bacterium]
MSRLIGHDRRMFARVFAPVLFGFLLALAGPAQAQVWPSPGPMGTGSDPLGGLAIPVHGNWCGPNHGAGPILDALDDSCFRHDFCVFQRGRGDCGCDLAFMSELRARAWPSPGLAEKARAVYEAIAMTPCRDPAGQREKMSRAAADWAAGVVAGREPPWAILDRLGRLMQDGMARAY